MKGRQESQAESRPRAPGPLGPFLGLPFLPLQFTFFGLSGIHMDLPGPDQILALAPEEATDERKS